MIPSNPSIVDAHSSSQEALMPETQSSSDRFKQALKNNFILIATIIAVILGVTLAFVIRENVPLKPPQKTYFGFPGAIFLRMLRFLLLPLISSSLIIGIAGLGSGNAGRIAGRALFYFFITTLISVAIGLVLVVSIKPGSRTKQDDSKPMKNPLNDEKITTIDTILDLIRNMFPDNMIQMAFQQYKTKLVPIRFTNSSEIDYWKAEASSASGINVLGIVIFCFIFGAVLCTMGESGRVLYDFFEALNVASLKIIGIIMMVSPLGIGSLVCGTVLEMDDPWELFKSISFYIITLITGLIIHGFVVLPFIFYLITKKNVFRYTYNMLEALIMAFATASSSATLPISIKCVEEKNKVSKMISKFVLPVGATINMDGTAMYEGIASIFLAQLNNRPISFVDLIITFVTASLASICAAGVPSGGLVTMVLVLSALNLPQEQISIFYAIDWLLDRFRTLVNVYADSLAAGIVEHLSKAEVQQQEQNQEEKEESSRTKF